LRLWTTGPLRRLAAFCEIVCFKSPKQRYLKHAKTASGLDDRYWKLILVKAGLSSFPVFHD
jgi:hypothetical protein